MPNQEDRVAVRCGCGKSYRLPADRAGRTFACKACGETLRAGSPEAARPKRKRGGRRERKPRPARGGRLVLAALAAAGLLAGAATGLVAIAVWGDPPPADAG